MGPFGNISRMQNARALRAQDGPPSGPEGARASVRFAPTRAQDGPPSGPEGVRGANVHLRQAAVPGCKSGLCVDCGPGAGKASVVAPHRCSGGRRNQLRCLATNAWPPGRALPGAGCAKVCDTAFCEEHQRAGASKNCRGGWLCSRCQHSFVCVLFGVV